MGFSPLARGKRIPDNGRSSARQSRIRGFTIHHQAGVDAHGEATNPRRQVSANYWITNDGTIIPNIDENRRAWTTGASGYPAGAASDHRNITVEVSNSPAGVKNGTWSISPAAERALIALIGDVFKRHGLGKVKRGKNSGVAVHRDFVPTSCPGPYIMNNLSRIIKDAEKARTGKTTGSKPGTSKPTPAPSKPSKGKSVSAMATEVIAGKHGNGHAQRQKSLGISAAEYAKVRTEVNRRVSGGGASKPAASKPASKSIAAMAAEVVAGKHGNGHAARRKSLGVSAATYEKVRAEVNRRVSGGGSKAAPAGKSISQMATEVIAGKHGNGHATRRKSLGVNAATYAKVRAEVNRRV